MKTFVIVLVLVIVGALLVAGLVARQRRQREGMQQRFGPEYDRTVEQAGDRRTAERDLQDRTRRHETLQIQPLDPGSRDQYAHQWRQTQEQFVDRPQVAVKQADNLVALVMQERGYPVGDFDQQVRDVSVEHSDAVANYRSAHQISQLNDDDGASTEQLREAMVHYRALFIELLDSGDDGQPDGRDDGRRPTD